MGRPLDSSRSSLIVTRGDKATSTKSRIVVRLYLVWNDSPGNEGDKYPCSLFLTKYDVSTCSEGCANWPIHQDFGAYRVVARPFCRSSLAKKPIFRFFIFCTLTPATQPTLSNADRRFTLDSRWLAINQPCRIAEVTYAVRK